MESHTHQISHILEVRLNNNVIGGVHQESAFLVTFSCQTCHNLENQWLSRTELINSYGIPEGRILALEEKTLKDLRDRETRINAEELLRYLEFSDIKDFTKVTQKDFEEINFYSENQS